MSGIIYVLCTPYIKTGGTELAHQLVYELRENGEDAYIVYTPSKSGNYLNPAYQQYVKDYKIDSEVIDSADNAIVIPEVWTLYLEKYRSINKYIWWMSVDNYFCPPALKEVYRNVGIQQCIKEIVKRIIRKDYRNVPLDQMADVKLHLVQSQYAYDYLNMHGIHNIEFLTDYINDKYFADAKNIDISKKENIVLYNPKKGRTFTKMLIRHCSGIKFIPLVGMSNAEVIGYMRKAKVYIDFGNHPGKDRLPREAATMMCCIVTSKRGAAKFYQDISIDDKYKFEDRTENILAIKRCINNIFENYTTVISDYQSYRKKIAREKNDFKLQIKYIFNKTTR